MKRVLVTGGAGFIGSHLIDALLARGDEVICADNLRTGRRSNVAHHHGNPNFEFLRHDVTFPLYVEVDAIFNLACPASPVHYQTDPVQTMKTSVHGAINLLGLAKRCGARILQASTSEVYGDPLAHPQREEYWGNVNPVGPRACYDEGKRAAETLFMDYNRQHSVDVRIARIFNTYGTRMREDDGRVVSNLMAQARDGELLTIYGDGKQTRSFCYVSDLVAGLLRFMDAESPPLVLNLGNPETVTMLDLAQRILTVSGSRSRIVHERLPQDDPRKRCPDITRAREALMWEPTIKLNVGLTRMWVLEYSHS